MIAPLAKSLDWLAIQVLAMLAPRLNTQNPRLEEALRLLNATECFPAESQPARVEFNPEGLRLHFRFPTPRPCEFAENNIVYGRLYRCAEQWQPRPVVVLLHGAGGFPDHQIRFPLMAGRFNRAGFNAATLEAPYNLRRRPRQPVAMSFPDCLRLAEASAQAVAEIRAFTGWLLEQGCPAVTLWGFSMGGWYAGMAVCRDPRLNSVVLASPAVRMNPWIEQRALWPAIRGTLPAARELCEKLNQTAVNLTSARPAIPRDRILLIEGVHDLLVPKEDVEDLGQAWGRPEIWRLPHGHFGVCGCGVPGLTSRVLRWLAPRLGNTNA